MLFFFLTCVAAAGNGEIFAMLLARGASPHVRNTVGLTGFSSMLGTYKKIKITKHLNFPLLNLSKKDVCSKNKINICIFFFILFFYFSNIKFTQRLQFLLEKLSLPRAAKVSSNSILRSRSFPLWNTRACFSWQKDGNRAC